MIEIDFYCSYDAQLDQELRTYVTKNTHIRLQPFTVTRAHLQILSMCATFTTCHPNVSSAYLVPKPNLS